MVRHLALLTFNCTASWAVGVAPAVVAVANLDFIAIQHRSHAVLTAVHVDYFASLLLEGKVVGTIVPVALAVVGAFRWDAVAVELFCSSCCWANPSNEQSGE